MGSSQSSSAKVGVNMASRISTGISAHRSRLSFSPPWLGVQTLQTPSVKLAQCPVSNPMVCTLGLSSSVVSSFPLDGERSRLRRDDTARFRVHRGETRRPAPAASGGAFWVAASTRGVTSSAVRSSRSLPQPVRDGGPHLVLVRSPARRSARRAAGACSCTCVLVVVVAWNASAWRTVRVPPGGGGSPSPIARNVRPEPAPARGVPGRSPPAGLRRGRFRSGLRSRAGRASGRP